MRLIEEIKVGLKISIAVVLLLTSCSKKIDFNSGIWKESDVTLDTRLMMIDDLLKKEYLINKTEIEISELIGHSARLNTINGNRNKYYPVFEKYGWDIDPEEMIFLEIHFNEKEVSDTVKIFKTK